MTRPANNYKQFIRVIVADSQAIFRAGLRKIFALEDDIRIAGQSETFEQTLSAVKKFDAEILIFEATLAERPVEALHEILSEAPTLRVVFVTETPNQELTLELFRRGAHSVISREVDSELFVQGLRKVAQGEPWLEPHAIRWVLDAYRTQKPRPAPTPVTVQLTPKEALIVSCVTQGMTNKQIAVRAKTTEQVVKNYLRKVYHKLGVADRLELALYCLNSRVLQDLKQKPRAAATAVPAVADEPRTVQVPAIKTTGSSKKP